MKAIVVLPVLGSNGKSDVALVTTTSARDLEEIAPVRWKVELLSLIIIYNKSLMPSDSSLDFSQSRLDSHRPDSHSI